MNNKISKIPNRKILMTIKISIRLIKYVKKKNTQEKNNNSNNNNY